MGDVTQSWAHLGGHTQGVANVLAVSPHLHQPGGEDVAQGQPGPDLRLAGFQSRFHLLVTGVGMAE